MIHNSVIVLLLFVYCINLRSSNAFATPVECTRRNSVSILRSIFHKNQPQLHHKNNRLQAVDDVAVISSSNFFKKKTTMNIPNMLTLMRVFLIPIFIGAFLTQRKILSVGLYIFSSITDLLDGWIARKYDMSTDFGVFLDPVADKLMVSTALILLVCQMPVWWFTAPVACIINREIAVSALRAWMAEKNLVTTVKVSNLGKWKTALQMISTTLLLISCTPTMSFDVGLSLGLNRMVLLKAAMALFYGATFLTMTSGLDYFKSAWPELSKSL